ncbi:MAG: glycyl-radical enzyme activating protein [Anaerolineales bacterium]|jgi:pyruvate formate lyase activating enzyme
MTEGRILNLQRFSTEDGPGLRTTVFFKGCSLRCAWCHNPESLSPRLQTVWYQTRCLGCHTCLSACPNGCLSMGTDGLQIDRERCQGCLTCARECPSGAIEALGKIISDEELVAELIKDRAYFESSGGGVTLSGGEPTFQPEFAQGVLRGLKEQGLSTALDTCGECSPRTLDRLLPYTDLVLYDLKLLDAEQHRAFTGQTNTLILENLLFLREYFNDPPNSLELWIRTPLIPGATATQENLNALGGWIARNLEDRVARWELCAFNNLCRDQYTRLGLDWAYAQTPLMSAEELACCEQAAKCSGVVPGIVHATGATRLPV